MKNILNTLIQPWTMISFKWGSRRISKWVKKNQKHADESRNPFDKRYKYASKKITKFIKRKGIEITTQNKDFLPKGAFMLVSSSSDKIALPLVIAAMKEKRTLLALLPEGSKNSMNEGYWKGINVYFYNEKNYSNQLNAVTANAKQNNVGLFVAISDEKEKNIWLIKSIKKFFVPLVTVNIKNINNVKVSQGTNIKMEFIKPIKPMAIISLNEEKGLDLVLKNIEA